MVESSKNKNIKNILRVILFCLAGVAWLNALIYVAFTYQFEILPISWETFGLILFSIDIFIIPALFLSFPKDTLSPRRVLVAFWAVLVPLYWIFSPLYEFLGLYATTRAELQMLMTNYIWEVPVIGLLGVAFLYYYFTRILKNYKKIQAGDHTQLTKVYKQLVRFPIFAGLLMFTISLIAILFGIFVIALPYLHIPPREALKEIINVSTIGLLTAILFFFVIGQILRSWLETLPKNKNTSKHLPDERLPFPLSKKLTIIVVAMSFFAFVVYVPVSYKHTQILLEQQIFERLSFGLDQFAQQGFNLLGTNDFTTTAKPYAVGEHGYIGIVDAQGRILTTHPQNFTKLQDILHQQNLVENVLNHRDSEFSFHYQDNSYIVALPLDNYHLISVAYETDFLQQLTPLITKSLIVLVVFGLVFAVLASYFIKGIANPISRLVKAAREMARHQHSTPVIVRSGDEIEILANEFAEMSKQINEYEHGLEHKIAERTAELKQTNAELEEKSAVLERVLEDVKKVDEELARLNHAKSEFISMASHQLRTPLTAIKWYTKILSNSGIKKLNPVQLRAYHQIVSANERMIELVNSLLNVSRLEMGTLAIEPQKIELGTTIKNALRDIWPLAMERKIKLTAGPFAKITATLDPKFLDIIISNLASNAVRYTPPGGKVNIALSTNGKSAIIKVADTGLGIPKNEQSQIFSKFFRATNILEKEPQGTGLGLYLTKSIVEMLGGKISFSSLKNKGTTFIVTLPRTGLKARPGAKGLIPMSLS